jgi:hypothetical protein
MRLRLRVSTPGLYQSTQKCALSSRELGSGRHAQAIHSAVFMSARGTKLTNQPNKKRFAVRRVMAVLDVGFRHLDCEERYLIVRNAI